MFVKKFDKNGQVIRYKARLVAKGFTQTKGVDYNEIWSPVAKFSAIRLLIVLCVMLELEAYQDDVPIAFLLGYLKEIIWMTQPRGYENGDAKALCLLLKTLYGLKQSPREWNEVLDAFLVSEGFYKSKVDPCIYIHKTFVNPPLFVAIYVAAIITIGKGPSVTAFRERLRKHFNITAGGPLNWYLGIAFEHMKDGSCCLNQSLYLQQKLDEFKQYDSMLDKRNALARCPKIIKN